MRNLVAGFFLFFIFYPKVLFTEYLIYSKNSAEPYITDENVYKTIYSTLMRYQWPMVIGYASQLPLDELKQLSAPRKGAEENFLRRKIQEISPTYDIAFIPTLVYELFVINKVKHNELAKLVLLADAMQKNPTYRITNEQMKPLMTNPHTKRQSFYDLYNQSNNLEVVRLAHQEVNNALIKSIKKFEPQNKNLKEIIDRHVNKLMLELVAQFQDPNVPFLSDPWIVSLLINLEYADAYVKNKGILYRGGGETEFYIVGIKDLVTPIELAFLTPGIGKITQGTIFAPWQPYTKPQSWLPFPDDPESTLRPLGSVSYGNTLLAGYFMDIQACAAYYTAKPTRIGYALLIDKEEYLSGNLRSLILQSLFSTLIGIFVGGEYFHSRTLSYAPKEFISYWQKQHPSSESSVGHPVSGFGASFLDKSGWIMRVGDPLQKAYELSTYIAENARIIKLLGQPLEGFAPSMKAVQATQQAQRDLTQMFWAMYITRKYIRKPLTKRTDPQKKLMDELRQRLDILQKALSTLTEHLIQTK